MGYARLCHLDTQRSGAMLIANAESRLERFDRGWVITFCGQFADGGEKIFCWKVYPVQPTDQAAIEALLLRAGNFGIENVGIVAMDRPEGKMQ